MRLNDRHGERGQSVPFWVMSILVAFTLAFFISNYSNTVKYQIRAQNAADSAAAAALSRDAAALNTTQTLLSAFDIQEARTRDVAAALPFVLGTNPCGATNLFTTACTSALSKAAGDLTAANNNLVAVANELTSFQKQVGGQLTDTSTNPQGVVNNLFAPNGTGGCAVNVLTDCDFKYSTFVQYNGGSGMPTVDEYACKVVTNTAAAFMHLPTATYYTIGHTTSTLAPASATYSPSTLGAGFQSVTQIFPDITGSLLTENLGNLNVNSALYGAVAAPPPTPTNGQPIFPARKATDVCP